MLASEYWKKGDRTQTISLLEKALHFSPDNKSFKESLTKAKDVKIDSDESIFTLHLSIRTNPGDL